MHTWGSSTYCWVVICKNTKVHRHTNLMFGHRIPLAETDQFEPMPVSGPFYVQCDDCRQKPSYEPEEVMRVEIEIRESFNHTPAILLVVSVRALLPHRTGTSSNHLACVFSETDSTCWTKPRGHSFRRDPRLQFKF